MRAAATEARLGEPPDSRERVGGAPEAGVGRDRWGGVSDVRLVQGSTVLAPHPAHWAIEKAQVAFHARHTPR